MSEKKLRQFFGSGLFIFGAFVLAVFLLFAYGRSYYQDYQIQEQIKNMRAEVGRLEAKKIETLEVLKYVKTQDFLEAKARTEFNLVKPGENVAIVGKNNQVKNSGQVVQKVVKSDNVPFYQRWWECFFKN